MYSVEVVEHSKTVTLKLREITCLNVFPEDPELGVVFKCDEAALSGGAHLSNNHNTEGHDSQSEETALHCVCVCVCVHYPLYLAQVVESI